ncbi:GTP-binding protein [Prolixibacteraceae bacterium JC049]|nr:GTP-binding protein [Prolixibacteraceae bacterium JC049]
MVIERDHIGFFGKMNSGKSSLMNLLTQQTTSIVDSTPGTTADTKITLQEIHGIGPVKLFDTAGIDEQNELGAKKRTKAFSNLKECDLVLLVINPLTNDFDTEKAIIEQAREHDKQMLVLLNLFTEEARNEIPKVEEQLPLLQFYPKLALNAQNEKERSSLIDFIIRNFESKNITQPLLPFLEPDEFYILNIPMDEETPGGRYLRPQAMCEEYITRNWAYPVSYRMNLGKARANDIEEKERFDQFLNSFNKRPKMIITDSQAMDIMDKWTPSDIQLTTFSIMMINYVSKGRLNEFVNGIRTLSSLQKGDKILIVEACNHSRIKEDIGTVQIPNYIANNLDGIIVEHNFGREFQENEQLQDYKLVIHCGGCMISAQKLMARLRELRSLHIPYTNYGVFLSYVQGKNSLKRVIAPWV